MKKIALILAIATVSTTLLAGCGKFTCSLCGEEKSGKKYESGLAKDEYICEDCKNNPLEGLGKGVENALEGIAE